MDILHYIYDGRIVTERQLMRLTGTWFDLVPEIKVLPFCMPTGRSQGFSEAGEIPRGTLMRNKLALVTG